MITHSIVWDLVLAIIALWGVKTVIKKYAALRQALAIVGKCPGGQILWIHPFRALSVILGHTFPRAGQMGAFYNKFSSYEKYGSTCLSSIVFWKLTPVFWLADADAIKAVASDRHTFPKDVRAYKALNIYGSNLVGTGEADWKRHRAVAKPAFNEANISFVWSESIRVVNEWFDQLDARDTFDTTIDTVSAMTQVTLFILSAAGFGRRFSWTTDSTRAPEGYRLSFQSALKLALGGLVLHVTLPKWIVALSRKIYLPHLSLYLKSTREAIQELRRHILEVATTARARVAMGQASQDAALLKNLVEANMAQEGEFKCLTDDELLSNIFAFLIAGHDTSSHSLSFTIAFLALYPDVQRKVHAEVTRLWPEGLPVSGAFSSYKGDFPKLEYTLAVVREALRHFPPLPRLAKLVHCDTTLVAQRFTPHLNGPNKHGNEEKFSVVVPAGSVVLFDIPAIHMNALHWGEDVNEFKPERFIDTDTYRWPRDAFLAFSSGPRGCIGERFALTESVYILAALVHRYEILVPDNLRSRPHEEQKRMMLHWVPGVTITPTNARVHLHRRSTGES